jgi:hypothetical protein
MDDYFVELSRVYHMFDLLIICLIVLRKKPTSNIFQFQSFSLREKEESETQEERRKKRWGSEVERCRDGEENSENGPE